MPSCFSYPMPLFDTYLCCPSLATSIVLDLCTRLTTDSNTHLFVCLFPFFYLSSQNLYQTALFAIPFSKYCPLFIYTSTLQWCLTPVFCLFIYISGSCCCCYYSCIYMQHQYSCENQPSLLVLYLCCYFCALVPLVLFKQNELRLYAKDTK